MISIAVQLIMIATFIGLVALVWRVSLQPRQRLRAVIYGWGGSVVWAVLCTGLLAMWLSGFMDSDALHRTFPDGTLMAGFLFGGWFWPFLIVEFNGNRA